MHDTVRDTGTSDSAQGSYRSCTFTQRKCLIKSESVCLSVWCAWEKKIRSVWLFCIVFAFTARPPPLDLRGLSTISECPFHVPLTRTEPRWELWQTHIYTPKWPQTDPLQLCSSSQPLLSVSYIFNKDTVFVLTLLFLKSPDLCDPLCTRVFSFTCLWCLWTPHWSYVNCKILFCIWKLLCFVSVCLSPAHHFSLFLWTGGEDGA